MPRTGLLGSRIVVIGDSRIGGLESSVVLCKH